MVALVVLVVVLLVAVCVFGWQLLRTTKQVESLTTQLKREKDLTAIAQNAANQSENNLVVVRAKLDAANTQLITISEQLNMANAALASAQSANLGLVARNEDDNAAVDCLRQSVEELEQRRANLVDQLETLGAQRDEVQEQLETTNAELASSLAAQRIVEGLEDEGGDSLPSIQPMPDRACRRTIGLVNELLGSITDSGLRAALLKWVWECAYRPVFQSELKKAGWWDATNVVYGLELIDSPGVWYIGQARSLRERWYQHARKMIGVDSAGNEKLYNHNIEDFRWCVIEQNVRTEDLNSREAYFIKWFGADGKGLNRKG